MPNPIPDLTVIIPARNEADCIGDTVDAIFKTFQTGNHLGNGAHLEVIVVDDHCTDDTAAIAKEHGATIIRNENDPGYGHAVRAGLNAATGHRVCVMVADGSDSPEDLLYMYALAKRFNLDSVFGHRWGVGGRVEDYPRFKRVANRVGNRFIGWCLGSSYSDWTNPFKIYWLELVKRVLPECKSSDFSLGMEIAARVHQLGPMHTRIVPHHWKNRSAGTSKFKVKHAVMFLRTLYRLMPEDSRERFGSSFGVILIFLAVIAAWFALRH